MHIHVNTYIVWSERIFMKLVISVYEVLHLLLTLIRLGVRIMTYRDHTEYVYLYVYMAECI